MKKIIGGKRIEDILNKINVVMGVISLTGEFPPGRASCGFFTIRSKNDGGVLLVIRVGEVPTEKLERYLLLSLEKSQRVYTSNLASSWQTRDEAVDKWGGAVLVNDADDGLILSFSGLPELADEAVVMMTAVLLGWNTRKEMLAISAISSNPFFPTLEKLFVER